MEQQSYSVLPPEFDVPLLICKAELGLKERKLILAIYIPDLALSASTQSL